MCPPSTTSVSCQGSQQTGRTSTGYFAIYLLGPVSNQERSVVWPSHGSFSRVPSRAFKMASDVFQVEEVKKMKIGDPLDRSTDHGPQNHRAHLDKLVEYCQTGVKEGATLVCGGRQVQRAGRAAAATASVLRCTCGPHRDGGLLCLQGFSSSPRCSPPYETTCLSLGRNLSAPS